MIYISTIGSKVCDDAIGMCGKGKINNINRIVEISPFVFNMDISLWKQKFQSCPEFVGDNEYTKKILKIDFQKNVMDRILASNSQYLVIDTLSARCLYYDFEMESGEHYRLTKFAASENNIELIRKSVEKTYREKIKSEQSINPMNLKDEVLEQEVQKFCTYIKAVMPEDQVIFLDTHNVFEYIDRKNRIMHLPHVEQICNYNMFYDKYTALIRKYLKCHIIERPKYLIGVDSEKNADMFNYSRLYYSYVCECVEMISNDGYSLQARDDSKACYEVKQNIQIEEAKLRSLVDITNLRRNGRKVVLIGASDVFQYDIQKRYGVKIDKIIPYNKNTSETELQKSLDEIKGKYKEYVCVVPYVYRDSNVLQMLWENGYGQGKGYIVPFHERYNLKNFVGIYEDCYQNRVESNRPVSISTCGVGNNIYIGSGCWNNIEIYFNLFSGITVRWEADVSVSGERFTSSLYDGARLTIRKNCQFEGGIHIRGSFFGQTEIGRDCIIEEKTVIFNGDGHAIIDLHTGNNINYDLNHSLPEKHQIVLGDGVKVGSRSFILAGTHLGNGCVIRDNSLVNKKFGVHQYVAGMPASAWPLAKLEVEEGD